MSRRVADSENILNLQKLCEESEMVEGLVEGNRFRECARSTQLMKEKEELNEKGHILVQLAEYGHVSVVTVTEENHAQRRLQRRRRARAQQVDAGPAAGRRASDNKIAQKAGGRTSGRTVPPTEDGTMANRPGEWRGATLWMPAPEGAGPECYLANMARGEAASIMHAADADRGGSIAQLSGGPRRTDIGPMLCSGGWGAIKTNVPSPVIRPARC
ncbi:hypothetical protein B0H19DRAFT_1083426 [Mycena capillaripes]|nr:hypothetical protein B0H19DRAFT_1083426 [Mycena capillaripes]